MGEAITILVLLVVSLLIYFLFKKIVRVELNPFGMILLWPIAIAAVNDWSTPTRVVSFLFVFVAIYLLTRKSRRTMRTP